MEAGTGLPEQPLGPEETEDKKCVDIFQPPVTTKTEPKDISENIISHGIFDSPPKQRVKKFSCDYCEKTFAKNANLNDHMRTHTGERPHKCDICFKDFAQASALIRHKRIHNGEKPYECNLCGKFFADSSNFSRHKKTHEGKSIKVKSERVLGSDDESNSQIKIKSESNKPFPCNECDKAFANASGLSKHMKRLHGVVKERVSRGERVRYQEDSDDEFFLSQMQPEVQLRVGDAARLFVERVEIKLEPGSSSDEEDETGMHGASTIQNNLHNLKQEANADGNFSPAYKSTINNLKKEVTAVDSEDENINIGQGNKPFHEMISESRNMSSATLIGSEDKEKLFSCEVCFKTFTEKSSLSKHMHVHKSGDKTFSCTTCGKTFPKGWRLRIHEKSHSGEKPHSCETCEQKFSTPSQLKIHKRIHTGERPYSCDKCGKTFTQKSSLNIHNKSHAGIKNYKCEICNKRFTTPSSLLVHNRFHTGEKPYTCKLCCKSFVTTGDLKRHMATHQTEEDKLLLATEIPTCDICNKTFTTKGGLSAHKKIHLGIKPHVCDTCGKSFHKAFNLNEHKKFHLEDWEKPSCDICGKSFSYKGGLNEHIRNIHSGIRPFTCEICGKAFYKNSNLNKHKKQHETKVNLNYFPIKTDY